MAAGDVAHAAVEEDVVLSLGHEHIELGHEGVDDLAVGIEVGQGAGALGGGGLETLGLDEVHFEVFLATDGGEDLDAEFAFELVADGLGDVLGDLQGAEGQTELVDGGVGLLGVEQVAGALLAFADGGVQLLDADLFELIGRFQRRLGCHRGRRSRRHFGLGRRRVGGLLPGETHHVEVGQALAGFGVLGIKLKHLLEEGCGMVGVALGAGLAAQSQELLRQSRGVFGQGQAAGQRQPHAGRDQQLGALPRSRGGGHQRNLRNEGETDRGSGSSVRHPRVQSTATNRTGTRVGMARAAQIRARRGLSWGWAASSR